MKSMLNASNTGKNQESTNLRSWDKLCAKFVVCKKHDVVEGTIASHEGSRNHRNRKKRRQGLELLFTALLSWIFFGAFSDTLVLCCIF